MQKGSELRAWYGTWGCVVLVLAAVCSLAGPAGQVIRILAGGTGDPDYVCQLDCFAEPAVATAVLRTEGDRLLNAFVQTRDLAAKANSPRREEALDKEVVSTPHQLPPGQEGNIRALERLRIQAEDLQRDLDKKLLAVYCECGLWNEFLEHFLTHLRQFPDDPVLIAWAEFALVHASERGEAARVIEALLQACRTGADPKIVRGLDSALEEWRRRETPCPETLNR